MVSRRRFTVGLGALGASALAARRADAQVEFSDPGKGPWKNHGFLQRAGGRLHYASLGDPQSTKPPVVLLHKLGGWLADWRHVAPALAEGRRVIAFDLPGHGESRWQGNPPYLQSLGETAALLVGAFDELGIAQVDLLGTSLGGCVSVPLSAYWPERVRRLALISVALGGARTLAEIKANIDAAQKDNFTAHGDPKPMDLSVSAKIMGHVHRAEISAEQNSSRRRAGRWIQPSERGVANCDVKGLLTRIQAPTLLVYGENPNSYLRFRAGAEAALKNGRTEVVPNSGAFVMQDNPAATAAILKRFVEDG